MRVLFGYAGAHKRKLLEAYQKGKVPGTAFFGFLELRRFPDVEAEFIDQSSVRGLSFNVRLLSRLWAYDIICSTIGLHFLYILSILPIPAPAWVVLNLNLTNLLERNRTRRIRYRVLIIALKRASRIVCLCEAQRQFLLERGLDPARLAVIRFGIDKRFFAQAPGGREGDYLLSVGHDDGRDYKTLFEAVRGTEIRTIVVCSRRNVEGISSIPENVELYYDLDYEPLRELYQNARLVVVPSHNEAFLDGSDCSGQTVVLDAMSAGRAVIATRRSWMSDYLADGANVLIVSPESPQELREAIHSVWEDRARRAALGSAAALAVSETLNGERMAEELHDLFVSVRRNPL